MRPALSLVGVVEVYIVLRLLGPESFPVHLTRHRGVTLLMIDPRASMLEVLRHNADHLSEAERNAMRTKLGEPLVGRGPLSDALVDGRVGDLRIPQSMFLPTPTAGPVPQQPSRAARFARTDVWEPA